MSLSQHSLPVVRLGMSNEGRLPLLGPRLPLRWGELPLLPGLV